MTLNVYALCPASQRWAVAQAAGVAPLTSPPLRLGTRQAAGLDPGLLEGRDLLYLALHGLPGEPYWYGDGAMTALSTAAFRGAHDGRPLALRNTVVFVASCHFTEGPFFAALLACRPRALIAGSGENYARSLSLVGPHLLGYYLRRALEAGLLPRLALEVAKARLRGATRRLQSASDGADRGHPADRAGQGKAFPRPRPGGAAARLAEDIAANRDALRFEVLA